MARVIIECKTCGARWVPFTSMTSFFDEHKGLHAFPPEPEYNPTTPNFDWQSYLKKRLEWKHIYFEDSRPDSAFGLKPDPS